MFRCAKKEEKTPGLSEEATLARMSNVDCEQMNIEVVLKMRRILGSDQT